MRLVPFCPPDLIQFCINCLTVRVSQLTTVVVVKVVHTYWNHLRVRNCKFCFAKSGCCQMSAALCPFLTLIKNLADHFPLRLINCLSCSDSSVCFSCADLLWNMVTFRKTVNMCTLSVCPYVLPGLEIPCLARYIPSSICVFLHSSLSLRSSPFSPNPPLLPSFPPCYPVKVIAIYRVGLICQSLPGILSMVTTGDRIGEGVFTSVRSWHSIESGADICITGPDKRRMEWQKKADAVK